MDQSLSQNLIAKNVKELQKEQAVEQLMDLYGQKIVRLSYTYVKDYKKAEDIAQETFLKCYEKWEQYNGEAMVQTWLYKIAVNLCKDYLKSWHYRKLYLNFADMLAPGDQTASDSAENQVFAAIEKENLAGHIMKLPLKYREVITLFYYQELSISQISEVIKLSEEGVKSRLRRARHKLRDAYGEEEDDR